VAEQKALWQLLLEDPSALTCDECFALVEFYAYALATTGRDLLPKVLEHLRACPSCRAEHAEALRRIMAIEPNDSAPLGPDLSESDGSDKDQ
jgi:hypothetical protein